VSDADRQLESALREGLAEHDLEFTRVTRSLPDGVQANVLHQVRGAGAQPVYVPIPVTVQVAFDPQHRITALSGAQPSAAAVTDAEKWLRTLQDNHQLANPGALPPGTTHQLIRDAQGRCVVRRRRFA
jgi:hypothetical protein